MEEKFSLPMGASADEEEARRFVLQGSPSHYVKLNVGGLLFHTTVQTLVKYDSMLRAMFSGRLSVMTDSDGFVLIDRSGKHFAAILNYLRDGTIPLPDSLHEVQEILAEAKFYSLQDLVAQCQDWINAFTCSHDEMALISMRRVPTVSTRREVEQVIGATRKPLIKLLLNRHNNKYSYTPMSDDNLMKNLELFDRLVVKFSERALFVKDTGADSPEICQWTFYENGVNKAEISCCSIVYAPEKKTIKVEFPEARIYEEAMHAVVLYERNNCWRCGAPSSGSCSSLAQSQALTSHAAPAEGLSSPVSSATVRYYVANDLVTGQPGSSSALSPTSAFASQSISINDRSSSSSSSTNIPDAPCPRIAIARPNRFSPCETADKLSD